MLPHCFVKKLNSARLGCSPFAGVATFGSMALGSLFMVSTLMVSTAAKALTFEEVSQALRSDPQATWSARPSVLSVRPFAAPAAPNGSAVGGASEFAGEHYLEQYFSERNGSLTSQATTEPGMPQKFDWRETLGGTHLSPIAAQGSCNSCVAFAIIAALESQLHIACGPNSPEFRLSTQYLFSCGGGSCRTGWRLSEAMDYITRHGVPDDACLPYSGSDGAEQSHCQSACANADARIVKDLGASQPTTGFINVIEIKRALKAGPLVANMILFEDLEFFAEGVYKHIAGNQMGSHAILIVGWNDQDKSWIVRNSWGPSWGESGYFKVSWYDVSLPGRYTWLFDVANAVRAGVCTAPR